MNRGILFCVLLHFSASHLYAQLAPDTLDLEAPVNLFYQPGKEKKIIVGANTTGLFVVPEDRDQGYFSFDQNKMELIFLSAPTDKDEHLLFIMKEKDTVGQVSLIPAFTPSNRPGFSRYDTRNILKEQDYRSFVIDSNNKDAWKIKMYGRKIIWGDPLYDVFYQFNHKEGQLQSMFKDVTIGADTLIIKERMFFPAAKLHINARVLIIDYKGKLAPIDITPLKDLNKLNVTYTPVSKNGIHADTLFLFYDQLVNNSPHAILFAANGGNGQDAAPGKHGKNFPLLTVVPLALEITKRPAPAHNSKRVRHQANVSSADPRSKGLVWIDWHHIINAKGGSPLHGTDWEETTNYDSSFSNYAKVFSPSNMHASLPIAGGRPGEPGNGGVIISSDNVRAFSTTEGGFAGEQDSIRNSGKITGPKDLWMLTIRTRTKLTRVLPATYEYAPLNYPKDSVFKPLLPAKLRGVDGAIANAGYAKQWMHLEHIKLTMDHALDLFRFGNVSAAESLLTYYYTNFFSDSIARKQYKDDLVFWDWENRVSSALLKMAADLDFYGNPPGFVPGMGIGETYAIYTQTIRDLSRAYAAAIYLEKQDISDLAAYEAAVNRIRSYLDSTQLINQEFQDIERFHMPYVQNRIDSSILYLEKVSARVKELEKQFRKKAEDIVEDRREKAKKKQFLKNVTGLAKVIPYGQPFLAAGASAFEALNAMEDGQSVFESLGNVYSDYMAGQKIQKDFNKFKNVFTGVLADDNELPLYKRIYEKRDTLFKAAGPYMDRVSDILKKLDFKKVSDQSVATEIQRLKDKHPEYKDLVDSVARLTELNKELVSSLVGLQLRLRRIHESIQVNTVAINRLQAGVTSSPAGDQQRADMLVTLQHSILEKLNYYQYMYAKAYEYFSLKQYNGYERTWSFLKGGRLRQYANYDSLAARTADLYLLDARNLQDEILKRLFSNMDKSMVSGKKDIWLQKNEIDRINSGKPLSINFFRRLLYNAGVNDLENYEELLIKGIRIRPVFDPASVNDFIGTNYTYGSSLFTIKHNVKSLRYREGKQYDFTHASSFGKPFYSWSFEQSLYPYQLSERQTEEQYFEIIRMLTGQPMSEVRKVVSFDSDFSITKKDNHPQGKSVKLDSLLISLDVMLVPRINHYGIYIQEGPLNKPGIPFQLITSTEMIEDVGTIYRSFLRYETVRINTPAIWNGQKFSHWLINDRKTEAPNSFELKVVEPIYKVVPVYGR